MSVRAISWATWPNGSVSAARKHLACRDRIRINSLLTSVGFHFAAVANGFQKIRRKAYRKTGAAPHGLVSQRPVLWRWRVQSDRASPLQASRGFGRVAEVRRAGRRLSANFVDHKRAVFGGLSKVQHYKYDFVARYHDEKCHQYGFDSDRFLIGELSNSVL